MGLIGMRAHGDMYTRTYVRMWMHNAAMGLCENYIADGLREEKCSIYESHPYVYNYYILDQSKLCIHWHALHTNATKVVVGTQWTLLCLHVNDLVQVTLTEREHQEQHLPGRTVTLTGCSPTAPLSPVTVTLN